MNLVFAHGLMGTGAVQRMQLEALVEAGWNVVTFDQRGHGASPPVTDPDRYDPVEMGSDLWDVADAAGFDRCWIGGGSMGAATSFCAARQAPDRVEGLIQAIPALRDTPHPFVWLFDALADKVRDEGTEGLMSLLHQLTAQLGATDDVFIGALRDHDAASIECALRSVPRWVLPDVPSAFTELPFPVVVVGWDDDPIHPLDTAKDIAAAAKAELLQLDQSVVFGDRALFGKKLLEVLPA